MHICGTRRSEQQVPPVVEKQTNTGRTPQIMKRDTNQNNSNSAIQSSSHSTESTFLESIKGLQEQMAVLTAKIQQMETNGNHWGYQQPQGYCISPRYPPNLYPNYLHQGQIPRPATMAGSLVSPTHQ